VVVEGDEGVVLPEVVEDPSILMIDAISVESEDIMHMIADVVGVADADLDRGHGHTNVAEVQAVV